MWSEVTAPTEPGRPEQWLFAGRTEASAHTTRLPGPGQMFGPVAGRVGFALFSVSIHHESDSFLSQP